MGNIRNKPKDFGFHYWLLVRYWMDCYEVSFGDTEENIFDPLFNQWKGLIELKYDGRFTNKYRFVFTNKKNGESRSKTTDKGKLDPNKKNVTDNVIDEIIQFVNNKLLPEDAISNFTAFKSLTKSLLKDLTDDDKNYITMGFDSWTSGYYQVKWDEFIYINDHYREKPSWLSRVNSIYDDFVKSYLSKPEVKSENKSVKQGEFLKPKISIPTKSFGTLHGRVSEKKKIEEFLKEESYHFLNIYGKGGIGKSHFIEHCFYDEIISGNIFYYDCIKGQGLRSLVHDLNDEGIVKLNRDLPDNNLHNELIKALSDSGKVVILDDFYELNTSTQGIIDLIGSAIRSSRGKIVFVTRSPIRLGLNNSQKLYLDSIGKEEFNLALKDYSIQLGCEIYNGDFTNEIFNRIGGWVFAGKELLRLKKSRPDIKNFEEYYELLISEENVVAESNGKNFVQRILSDIYSSSKGNEKFEEDLFFSMSILEEPVDIEVLKILGSIPSMFFNSIFHSLQDKKKLIYPVSSTENGLKMHALHKEVCYELLDEKIKADYHKKVAAYYSNKFKKAHNTNQPFYKFLQKSSFHFQQQDLFSENKSNYDNFFLTLKELNIYKDVYYFLRSSDNDIIDNASTRYKTTGLPHYKLELARAYLRSGETETAIEHLRDGLKNHSDNFYFQTELGKALRSTRKQQDYREAIQVLLPAAKRRNKQSMNELAISYRDQKKPNYLESIYWFNELLKDDSLNEQAKNELGKTYQLLKDYKESIKWYLLLIKQNPKNDLPYLGIGITYRLCEEFNESIKYLKKGARLGNLNCVTELGRTYRCIAITFTGKKRMSYLKMTKKTFKNAIKKGNHAAVNELARLYRLDFKDSEKALIMLKDEVSFNNNDEYYKGEIASIYIDRNEYGEAIQWLKEIENPQKEAITRMAIAYGKLRNHKKSISILEDFLSKPFNNKNNYVHYILGVAYQNHGDYIKSIENLKIALKLYNKNAFNELANSFRMAGQYQNVINLYNDIWPSIQRDKLSFAISKLFLGQDIVEEGLTRVSLKTIEILKRYLNNTLEPFSPTSVMKNQYVYGKDNWVKNIYEAVLENFPEDYNAKKYLAIFYRTRKYQNLSKSAEFFKDCFSHKDRIDGKGYLWSNYYNTLLLDNDIDGANEAFEIHPEFLINNLHYYTSKANFYLRIEEEFEFQKNERKAKLYLSNKDFSSFKTYLKNYHFFHEE